MDNFNHFINSHMNDLCLAINLDKLEPELRRNSFLIGEKLMHYNLLAYPDLNSRKKFILEQVLNKSNLKDIINVLLYTGHDEISRFLALNLLQVDLIDMIDLTRCDPKNNVILEKFSFGDDRKVEDLVVDGSINSVTTVYPMVNSPRGYCLLINNHFTIGTFKEMQKFRDIFYQLHFDVIMKKNLNKLEIMRTLEDISKRDELSQHNAFVCMIIAHGNIRNEIYGFDGEPINIRTIMDMINNHNCPKLISKPRLFFFNCCRGDRNQFDSPTLHVENNFTTTNEKLIAFQDEFVCYSTLHGYTAHVDWNHGTVFGAVLADSLIHKAWYKELNQIVTRTNSHLINPDKVHASKQVFEWSQCLVKEFYFLPFLPEIKPITSRRNSTNNDSILYPFK